ncbi:MAG: DUF2889 domain-containing protein [Planctomycetota bacterium]|jgi:hypothetical protein
MDLYERNINASVSRDGPDHIRTKASLLDLNHNMRVEIRVRVKDRTIVDAESRLLKTPFKICKQTESLVKNLIGLKIERGVTRKLSRLLGRSTGCTHILELTVEAIRLSSNVMLGFEVGDEEWRERKLPDEEFISRAMSFLSNSCLPFKTDDENKGK